MSTAGNVIDVSTTKQFQDLLSTDLKRISLIYFWTSWAAPCEQMSEVVRELGSAYPRMLVLRVEAEEQSDISESFDINSVPTCLVIQGHALLDRIEGGDASRLTETIAKCLGSVARNSQSQSQAQAQAQAQSQFQTQTHAHAHAHGPGPGHGHAGEPSSSETEEELEARMGVIMNQSDVVLFMKGEPDAPRCGFSKSAVALLREKNVGFTHFDILSDEGVRHGLKKLNDWPTYPQFIVRGEFVGGLDVVKEMKESGEFDGVFFG